MNLPDLVFHQEGSQIGPDDSLHAFGFMEIGVQPAGRDGVFNCVTLEKDPGSFCGATVSNQFHFVSINPVYQY
jgi:hypothetical protein